MADVDLVAANSPFAPGDVMVMKRGTVPANVAAGDAATKNVGPGGVQAHSAILDSTTASFTLADEAKLDALPDSAALTASLSGKANLSGGAAFSGGLVTVPNVTYPDNTANAANTAFVTTAIGAAVPNTEAIQDIVGGMVSGNAETNIAVTYDDVNGKLDFSVTGSGVGDVTGPVGAINDAPTVFNGTTGKIIKATTYPAFKTALAITKTDVGLGSVDNVADIDKPISTATQTALNLKVAGPVSSVADAPMLFNGTTGKVAKETTYPAFKTNLALTKSDVGLSNVDNTSDVNKPVSTATQTALNLKADASTVPDTETIQDIVGGMVTGNTETNIVVTYNDTTGKLDFSATGGGGGSGDVTGPASSVADAPAVFNGTSGKIIKYVDYGTFKANLAITKADIGLSNVDNTSDAAKPISTATQTALNLKADASGVLDAEAIQDLIGGMVVGNVETNITVTYNDSTGKLDFVATAGSGVGDVIGPASSVADAPVLFDGLTGKLIKETSYSSFKASLSLTKADVGLASVDNTADVDKPISTATQTALNTKADAGSVLDAEGVQDVIGAMVSGNTESNIAVTYDDASGKLNFSVPLGAGDVTGPASSVNDAPVLFSGTTGKVIRETTYPALKTSLGLGSVDNTADTAKPVSTAQQTAIDGRVADTGDTMTGMLQFSGVSHAGLKLLSLTTAQRNAFVAQAGMLILNTTTGSAEFYNGTSWVTTTVSNASIQAVFDSVIAAGGAPATAMSTSLNTLIALTAVPLAPATAAQMRAQPNGFFAVTPQANREDWVAVPLTASGTNMAIDASTFTYGTAVVATDIDFSSVTGLTADPVYVGLTASGATRAFTASAFDGKGNVGALGVPCPNGVMARFMMWASGGLNHIMFEGFSTDPWVPTASTRLAFDASRQRVLLTDNAEAALIIATPTFKAKNVAVVELGLGTDWGSPITVANGKDFFTVPLCMNGWKLTRAISTMVGVGTSGGPMLVQIDNGGVDALSTRISHAISVATGTAGVINAANNTCVTNALWRTDVDQVFTGGYGGTVVLEFAEP